MARLRKRQVPTGKFSRGYSYTPRGAFSTDPELSGQSHSAVLGINQAAQESYRSRQRAALLEGAIAKGKLSVNDLSTRDASLLGLGQAKKVSSQLGVDLKTNNAPHGPSGFLSNLLGERGLEGAVTHLPQGVFEMGKSAVHDIQKSNLGKAGALFGLAAGGPVGALIGGGALGALGRGKQSEVKQNIVDPIGQSYAYMYGGKGAHGKNFWQRFYDQPLGPLLDIVSVASLGVGGAARGGTLAAKAARATGVPLEGPLAQGAGRVIQMSPTAERVESFGNTLASMTSRGGRRPTTTAEINPDAADIFQNETGAEIRSPLGLPQYSPRPLMKLGQKAFDVLAGSKYGMKSVKGVSLEHLRNVFISNKAQNIGRAQLGLQTQLETQKAIAPFVKLYNRVPHLEQRAWFLAAHGITSRTKLLQAANFWSLSAAGKLEHGANAAQHAIQPEYRDYLASLAEGGKNTDAIVHLLENPTENMLKIDRAWQNFLEDAQTKLVDPEGNPLISPEEQLSREWLVRKTLSQADTLEGAKRAFETWRYNQGLSKIKAIDQDLELGGLSDAEKATVRDYGYPITPKYVPHIKASDLGFSPRPSLVQRVTRADVEPQLRSSGIRRSNVSGSASEGLQAPFQGYLQEANEQLFRAGAVRMDVKALINTASQITRDLVFKDFNPAEMRRISVTDVATGEPRKFKSQTEVNYATGKTSKDWVWVPEIMQKYYQGSVDALAVLAKGIQELKSQGVKLEDLDDAGVQRWIEPLKEHAGVFTKDFVGTAEATGYAVPRTYLDKALQHAKAAEGPTSTIGRHWNGMMNVWRTWVLALMPRWWINTAVGSFFMATVHGTWEPKTFALAHKLMRGKATEPLQQLFEQHAAHVRLGGVVGAERMEVGGASRARAHGLYSAVQHIEDFFRTSAFVKQLKREERHSVNEVGDVLKTFTPFRFWAEDEGKIAQLMSNPVLVDSAVDEVNKFFYNYLQLGPGERLYIRQFIPFWGWYKFITKFVWRLPVAYPGRANIIAHLGMVGQEQEEQLGVLPDYLKGSIFLNKDLKHLKLLSTFGINPMSQFANPYSIRGGLPGVVNLSQLNPVAQAGLQAFGISPLGGETGIAPTSGISSDFLGSPIDVRQGKEIDLQQKWSFPRFFGSLLRSVPQVRLGELAVGPHGETTIPGLGQVNLPGIQGTAGRPAYPESIPFLREHPIPVRAESRKNLSDPLSMLLAYTGLAPKTRDQKHYLDVLTKRIDYAKSKQKRELKRYRAGVSK